MYGLGTDCKLADTGPHVESYLLSLLLSVCSLSRLCCVLSSPTPCCLVRSRAEEATAPDAYIV